MENKDLKKILKEQIPQEEKIGFAPNKTSEKNTGDSYWQPKLVSMLNLAEWLTF